MSRPASWPRATAAQAGVELRLTGRRGENLLAIVVIPVALLLVFGSVDVFAAPTGERLATLVPGTLALAVIATAFVNLGIATAYERSYGVLKRLGMSPLGRTGLIAAKAVSVGVIVAIQAIVIGAVAVLVLGWRPGDATVLPVVLVALVLGTLAFASLGLLLAGTLRAEATLALANGLFVAAVLVGGIVVPLDALPAGLAAVAQLTPAAALAELLRVGLGGAGDAGRSAIVLVAWTIVAGMLAARWFRWD